MRQYRVLFLLSFSLLEFIYCWVPNLVNKNKLNSKSSLNSISVGRNLKQEVDGGEISYDYYESDIDTNPAILYLPCLN